MNLLTNENISFSGAGLFKTDRDWIHPDRTEVTYEIIYVVRGQVYLEEDGNPIRLDEGSLCILKPHSRHVGTRHTRDVSFYWVHFLCKGELPFEKRFFEKFENKALFKELLHWNNTPNAPECLVNVTLVRILSEFAFLASENPVRDERAEAIKEWIRINATAELSVAKVAKHFEYSTDHVSRVCKKYYGISTKKLIDRMLMEKSRTYLCNTGKYVKEIAFELGFSSDKDFIGFFKYHEGCFPSEYRNRFPMIHMNRK